MSSNPSRRLGHALLALALSLCAVLAACASDRADRADRRIRPMVALAKAQDIAAKDPRLAAVLAARQTGEGWDEERHTDGKAVAWTSPGWRGVTEKRWAELGA